MPKRNDPIHSEENQNHAAAISGESEHELTEEQEIELQKNCKETRRSVPYVLCRQEYICKAKKGVKQTMERETIDGFLRRDATLTDCNGITMSGYFAPCGKNYKLFPNDWEAYAYKPSHIRAIEPKGNDSGSGERGGGGE